MKRLFIVLFVIVSFLIVGCEKQLEEPLCNKPYFEYMKEQCCLDANDNRICDKDETQEGDVVEEDEQPVVTVSQEEFIKGFMNNVVAVKTDYGNGSGFFMDNEGYVITNHHVIRGYENGEKNVTVKSYDGGHSSNYNAKVIGYDYAHDIAVLKVDSKRKWNIFPLAEDVRVGDNVYALGSPFDYEFSVSKGIISAKNRPGLYDETITDYFQTDTPINFGNSGGPLVNEKGEVVGLNTWKIGLIAEGMGFALDSKKVKEIYQNIRNVADIFYNPEWDTIINKNFNGKINIFIKEFKITWDPQGGGKGRFVSFNYIAQNKDSIEHSICFDTKIMKGGVIISNQLLEEKIKLTAGMQKADAEQIFVKTGFTGERSNYHFIITSRDCETKELYSISLMKKAYYEETE